MERNRYAVCVRTPRDSGTLFARFHETGGTHGAASRSDQGEKTGGGRKGSLFKSRNSRPALRYGALHIITLDITAEYAYHRD